MSTLQKGIQLYLGTCYTKGKKTSATDVLVVTKNSEIVMIRNTIDRKKVAI